MSYKVQQSVCPDCVTYVKSRIDFNNFNTFNNVVTFSGGKWNLNIFSSTNLEQKDFEFASSWTCNDKKQVHGLVIVILRKECNL